MDSGAHELSFQRPVPLSQQNAHTTNSYGETQPFNEANEINSVMESAVGQVRTDYMNANCRISPRNECPATYDTSPDRRKRRKTSHEPETEPDHYHVSEVQDEKEQTIKFDGLVLKPSSADHVENSPGPLVVEEKQNSTGQPASPTLTPKRRGRPPKYTQETSTSSVLVAKAIENNRQETNRSTSPQLAAIPQKATMKVSADGKLFGSLRSPRPQISSRSVDVKVPSKITGGGKSLALKNGKLAPNLIVVLRYNVSVPKESLTGAKIEQIMSGQIRLQPQHNYVKVGTKSTQTKPTSKSTHPFFLAKAPQSQVALAETTQTDGTESKQEAKKPVAWKDLAFKSNKMNGSKGVDPERPYWPPLAYQHVGASQRLNTSPGTPPPGKYKSKMRMGHIVDEENILSLQLIDKKDDQRVINDLSPPQKLRDTAANVLDQHVSLNELQNNIRVVASARNRMLQCRSAFDKAEPSGPYPWTQQYSPKMWEEVLQSTSHVLFEWLSALVVHNVKQGQDSKQAKPPPKRRKRPKKRNDEFADFIDFDEEPEENTKVKNAILIVGPNGCGKTASVFAVAKQLAFEVFEIHPGMRRSQKDIFEKVGDMTQNHMVQRGQNNSRASSVLDDADLPSSPDDMSQPSLASFLAPTQKKAPLNTSRSATPQPSKQTQRQSLILIEEVDQVFEDDRGFWSGVQALIQNSKRPVVLTCNDTSNVPLGELDLFNTLIYTAPPSNIVAEYLCYIAAAEGHVIQQDVIRSLYNSKGQDLRATMTELQFWCQMGVGSTQGGLDWFPSHKPRSIDDKGSTLRTFSKSTFLAGLDLLPVSSLAPEENLRFASESLGIPYDAVIMLDLKESSNPVSSAATLQQALEFMEARSDADCMETTFQPLMYSVVGAATPLVVNNIDRIRILEAKITSVWARNASAAVNYNCLNALSTENSINSLGNARPAASLDSPRSVLACDIAPYIRSVVSYDLELERQRDETFSSQGKKSRTTRAARAAAEGGDKASTRRERWFTGGLDVQEVLRTGNSWPQWSGDQHTPLEKDEAEANTSA